MMKFLCFVLAAVFAAVSAIDIRFGGTGNCIGVQAACLNHLPNRCCFLPDNRKTNHLSFGAVPGDWRITMRAHVGTFCDLAYTGGGDSQSGQGLKDYCYFSAKPSYISSGDYFFSSKSLDASTVTVADGSLVNALILEDGTKYGLHDLDEAAIAEAVDAAFNGTAHAAITKFKLVPLPN